MLENIETTDEADWIWPRLSNDFGYVSIVTPNGFPAYATFRIEHTALAVGAFAAATTTPTQAFFLLWEGYGYSNWMNSYADKKGRLIQPEPGDAPIAGPLGRRYWPLIGDLDEGLVNADYPQVRWVPDYAWPKDRAWIISNDMDSPNSYVGGSQGLVDALVGVAGLNASQVELTTTMVSTFKLL